MVAVVQEFQPLLELVVQVVAELVVVELEVVLVQEPLV